MGRKENSEVSYKPSHCPGNEAEMEKQKKEGASTDIFNPTNLAAPQLSVAVRGWLPAADEGLEKAIASVWGHKYSVDSYKKPCDYFYLLSW